MRGLFRSALALFAVGLAMIGCNRSDPPPDPSSDKIDAPFQAAFRVPGMS
jgi:hypothetical protein